MMRKRGISLLLALCLLFALSASALAATDGAEEAAQALYGLGLFRGTGTNEDGTPNFDLNRTPNRAEAVTMLVRLLGKEKEAEAGSWELPFTDVPDWAVPYVGYAYANGLTNGYSDTTFGSDDPVNATQYLTFVLRALGYRSGEDFRWDAAWELSDEIGLTSGEYSENSNDIDRGNLAVISNDALDAAYKGEETTLLDGLKAAGAVPSDETPATPEDKPEDNKPAGKTEQGENGLVISVTSQEELTAAVNKTEKVEAINIVCDFTVTEDSGVSLAGDKLEYYSNVTVTVEEGVTLTVGAGGQIGNYWFSYEGDWEHGTFPDTGFTNRGTIVVEKDGWVNGDIGDNYGVILVKDGGQCQTIPKNNYGTVTVESGGSFRTTQGENVRNEGTITVAEGANMVARFGSAIINNGQIEINGLFSVGCVTWEEPTEEGVERREKMWFENNGTVTGTGTVRLYDTYEGEGEGPLVPTDMNAMEARMHGQLGSESTLTIEIGEDSGV